MEESSRVLKVCNCRHFRPPIRAGIFESIVCAILVRTRRAAKEVKETKEAKGETCKRLVGLHLASPDLMSGGSYESVSLLKANVEHLFLQSLV